MKIAVKNFGPIKHGEIDLSKRFYVFVGHNNSGKTYMANLLWAFEKMSFNISMDKLIEKIASNELYHPTIEDDNFIFSDNQILYLTDEYTIFLKDKLADNLKINKEHFLLQATDFSVTLTEKDKFNSNSSAGWFSKEKDFNNQFTVFTYKKIKGRHTVKKVESQLTLQEKESLLKKVNLRNSSNPSGHFSISMNLEKPDKKADLKAVLATIMASFNTNFSFPFFLPSDRTFYPRYYQYIFSSIQREMDDFLSIPEEVKNWPSVIKGEFINKSKLPYKKSVSDVLSNLVILKNQPNNHYSHLIEKLKPILSGDIVARSAEGIGPSEFRLQIEKEKELELYLSSSAANQLTTLYLYLKYWAKEKNNLLIIDEPEENLHPKSQLLLLNVLMEFANMNNNRVVITTHSPLMAEAVNNHIQVAKLQDLGVDVEKIIEENGFDIGLNDNIRQKDFGVYFFGHGTITPYDVNNYGVYFRDFKQEQKKVDRMADIFSDHIYDTINKEEFVNT